MQANGALKDALCRGFLLALHRQGAITLPACKRPSTSHLRRRTQPEVPLVDTTPLVGSLDDVKPLSIVIARGTPYEPVYKGLIHNYHYLGYTTPVGEHVEYMAFSGGRAGRVHWLVQCSPPYRGAR